MILGSEINISLSFSPIYLILGIIASIIFSIWMYKVTLPRISFPIKMVLTSLRSLAIILILAAIFEPVITFLNKNKVEPKTLVLIDNSSSILNYSKNDSLEIIKSLEKLNTELTGEKEFYSFGKMIRKIDNENFGQIKFTDSLTNISDINQILKEKNEILSSVILISDGNYNSGSDPSKELSKLGIPMFTVGIGDTLNQNDIDLRKIQFNKFLYAGTETSIKAIVLNNGYPNRDISVTLQENNMVIHKTDIKLAENGINFVEFIYSPELSGEKKLSISVSELENETSYSNNKKSFLINVIDNKLNISILSSAPSADAKFIFNSLKQDDNINITRSIQISGNKFLDDFDYNKIADSDILYLVGFPGKNSPSSLINLVKKQISNNIPFLIVVNENTDLQKLKEFNEVLPFSVKQISSDFTRVFVNVVDANSPLLGQTLEDRNLWNSLPPVLRNNSQFTAYPGSNVLAKYKVGNVSIDEPLIITRNMTDKKSIAVICGEIWKWKLNDKKNSDLLFDNFINTSVKWLRDEDGKTKLKISSDKKIYSTVERIYLSAELYDEAFNPLPNSEIKAELISDSKEVIPLKFNYTTNGLYDYSLESLSASNYTLKAEAFVNGKYYAKSELRFSVEVSSIEDNSTLMNFEFLNNLASVSNGKFYYLKDINNISKSVNNLTELINKEDIEKTEFRFWSDEVILIIIILLLATEWFIRKRIGMI